MIKPIVALIAIFLYNANSASAQESKAAPHQLVYKAGGKYKNLVAVELSDDKKRVVSYPAPSDIKTGSSASAELPVSLHGGYWLDRSGVSASTVYVSYTRSEYSKLKKAPSPEQLYKKVVDKDAVKELCDCGNRNTYSVKQLNTLIDKKQLRTKCKVIK
jgi:hypothetical protein